MTHRTKHASCQHILLSFRPPGRRRLASSIITSAPATCRNSALHCANAPSRYRLTVTPPTPHALKAGAAYFAIVFAAGFVLGTARVLLVIPLVGELPATLLELPVMLGISWFVCGKLIKRFKVPQATSPRVIMGAVAFSLLMFAEVILSLTIFQRPVQEFTHELTTPQGLLGLAGQIAFALMPLIRRAR